MGVDNLNENYNLITKRNKLYSFNYFLVESNGKISINTQISDFCYIYSVDHLNHEKIPDVNADQILKFKQNQNENLFYYIFAIKVVSLDQGISEPDPEVGIGVDPILIISDLLNVVSLFYGFWFKKKLSIFTQNDTTRSLINERNLLCQKEEKLSNNLEKFCELRTEQYYLVQKCLKRFHESIFEAKNNISLAFVLLSCSIEPAAMKYSKMEDKFEETDFGERVKNLIFKKFDKEIESEEFKDKIYEAIGDIFLKTQYNRIFAKVKSFALKYYPPKYKNELTAQMIGDLYYLRSKYLHSGYNVIVPDNMNPTFNITQKKGKLKNFSDEMGKHVRLARLPRYWHLYMIFKYILINWINFLNSVKDSEEDKELFNNSDFQQRNVVKVSINKPRQPGHIVTEADYYKEMDYVQLDVFTEKVRKTYQLIVEKRYIEVLEISEPIVNHFMFDIKFEICFHLLRFHLESLYRLKRYSDFIEIIDKFDLELNQKTLDTYNFKAYCYAELKRYSEAQDLIDNIIELSSNDKQKANFFDSKGDFFKFTGENKKAVEFYDKSLDLGKKQLFTFHKETKIKREACKKLENK